MGEKGGPYCPNCYAAFDVEEFMLISDLWLCPYCRRAFNEDYFMKGNIVKLPIDQIKWAKHTMREDITPESVKELADSIAQVGLEHPIKVRPVNGQYEVVFGHRRLEAHKLLGKTEIETQVEDLDDGEAMVQAIIENYHRADAEPMSFARMLDSLKNFPLYNGKSGGRPLSSGVTALSRITGISEFKIRYYLQLLDEDEEVQELIQPHHQKKQENREGRITPLHVEWAKRELKDDKDARTEVLKKAAKEGLTAAQTQEIAKRVKMADSPEKIEALFELNYPTILSSPSIVRATESAKKKEKKVEKKKRQENPREVAEYLDAIKTFQKAIEVAIKVAEYGKFSPESGPFIKNKHDQITSLLMDLEVQLGV